jgi:Xaa-Pro aminopeptidase
MPVFADVEYAARVARAQRQMHVAGLGAIWITTDADIRYFTGYLTRFWESPTRPWHVLIPADGAPIAIIPSIGAELMGRTWVEDIRTWGAPDYEDDGVSLLLDAMQGRGKIGTPSALESTVRMPLDDLRRVLTEAEIVPDGGIVAGLRAVKSEPEIDVIRRACHVAGRAFARVGEIAGEGVPLDRVFRDFQKLCLDEGADWVPFLVGASDTDGYVDIISPATPKPIMARDVLMMDTGCIVDGYFCDYDRNFSIGTPDAATQDGFAKLVQAVDIAMAVVRPGARACDVFDAMAELVGAGGGGRLGHALGLQLTEGLSLIPADKTVLTEGMILTLEPSLTLPNGKMLVHEENIVVRDGVPERLSPFSAPEMVVI